ncbi:MAG TPA: endolytic transglycosylase MltG [Methylophilaceae bacterium]|nr:endolytic transglycosylase MltG [Methylophilaceae bacterium]
MMRIIKFTMILGMLAIIGFSGYLAYYAKSPLKIPSASQEVSIKANSGLSSIANQLIEQGVIKNKLSFVMLARLMGKESSLQAGEYTLKANVTPYELLLSLTSGKTTQAKITFIEGKTFKDMLAILEKNKAVTSTVQQLSNTDIMDLINPEQSHPEGLFFPDTYYFDRGTKDIVLLKRAHEIMTDKLEQAWQGRESGLPYKNSYEALIMASIVEKETGKASERSMIAGVFVNRMRIGMKLQTDPTVIYGMGDSFDGNIRRKDLRKDTSYNTYTRYGLPPTPIAMPSLASIEAALHPAKTKALYFVGKGDGSHAFSDSLVDHNRAVAKYQLKR